MTCYNLTRFTSTMDTIMRTVSSMMLEKAKIACRKIMETGDRYGVVSFGDCDECIIVSPVQDDLNWIATLDVDGNRFYLGTRKEGQ